MLEGFTNIYIASGSVAIFILLLWYYTKKIRQRKKKSTEPSNPREQALF